VASLWSLTSCVALAVRAVRWRIEQAEEFREEVERYTDAERVILADADQTRLHHGPLPYPSSSLVIHRFRDPRAGSASVLGQYGERTADLACCIAGLLRRRM
jgi:hypothetical protein